MRFLKIVAILMLLGLTVFLLCGCGESFVYKTYTDEMGGIHKEYWFTYDKEASDAEEVKAQAKSIMKRFVSDRDLADYAVIDDSTEGQVVLYLYFPSATDYQIALGNTGREKPEEDADRWEGAYVVSDAQLSSYLDTETISEVRGFADEEYADFPLEGTFYYVYGTPYASIRSNGETVQEDGIYYHTWQLYPDSPTQMRLRAYSPNGVILYASIILLFVLSLIVIFVIIYINKKNQRKMRLREIQEEVSMGGEDLSDHR